MADPSQRQSALAPLGLRAADERDAGAVSMTEIAHTGKIDLRGATGDERFTAAVRQAVGTGPPVVPLTSASAGARTILWLGPDEWLATCPPGDARELFVALRQALDGVRCAVTDLTDAQTVIRVAGPRARDLIAKGCTLDLHARVFGPGRVARGTVAHAAVILHQTSGDGEAGGPAFDLYVARSFAEHLWRWLADAAREYGPGEDA